MIIKMHEKELDIIINALRTAADVYGNRRDNCVKDNLHQEVIDYWESKENETRELCRELCKN